MDEEKFASLSADVDMELCKSIIEECYNLQGSGIKKLDGYDVFNIHLMPPISQINDNSYCDICPHGYVLKVLNLELSENIAFIKEYINVLLHLNAESVPCPLPMKNKNGDYFSHWINPQKNKNDRKNVIIMHTYLEGEELQVFKCDEKIAFSLGQLMSKLHLHLEPFRHSKAMRRPEFPWCLEAVPNLRALLNGISVSEERRNRVQLVINEFENQVLSKLNDLEKGVIHNDLNDGNLLVRRHEGMNIEFIGIIDFLDMVYTAYLFEIANTMCYLCLNNPDDPIKLTTSLLAGYDRRPLNDTEYRLLKICICARLVQSLVMGLHAYSLNASNEYVLKTHKVGWKVLEAFYDMNNEYFVKKIRTDSRDKQKED